MNIIKFFLLRIYYNCKSIIFIPRIKLFNRHKSYKSYLLKQKEKTSDPKKKKKWLTSEWQIKLDGFKKIFLRNHKFIKNANKCLCLGSRTGQEVKALRDIGKDAIGIDLVSFPPYTIIGDIHNLNFNNKTFDLVFTNVIDHSLNPFKMVSEMERVTKINGIIIVHLALYLKVDDYAENEISNPKSFIKMFVKSKLIISRAIKNNFDSMNWEIIMKKN